MTTARSDEMTGRLEAVAHERLALERFIEDHYPRLLVLAGLVSGDRNSAQDVVQVALERAWRARHTLRDPDRLRPWLDQIVVREAACDRRSRLAWVGRLLRPATEGSLTASGREPTDPAASRFPERSAIRGAFAELSAAQRSALVLTVQAGYSIDEAAAILGVPRDTVRSRLRAAREHLRHALREGD